MDSDPPVPPSSSSKKPKFTPKAPPRRTGGLLLPKLEANADDDNGEALQALMRQMNEPRSTRGAKVEKKASGLGVLSYGAGSSSSSLRTYNSSNLRGSAEESIVPSSSTAKTDEDVDEMTLAYRFESLRKTRHEYQEPWDYRTSYCPNTVPWRPSNSGDPELLDEEEFGEEKEHDESNINSALELGLLEDNKEPQMLFFQLPPSLPLHKPRGQVSASAKGKEKIESTKSSMDAKASVTPVSREDVTNRCSSLEELPAGFMGKMLVYKSGAIKLKLGDNIFNVSSGTPSAFAQDAAVMNSESKVCFVLGELNKRAVVTPDLNSILDSINLS